MAHSSQGNGCSAGPVGVAKNDMGIMVGVLKRHRRSSTDLSIAIPGPNKGVALAHQVAAESYRGSEALVEAGILGLLIKIAGMDVGLRKGLDGGEGELLSFVAILIGDKFELRVACRQPYAHNPQA